MTTSTTLTNERLEDLELAARGVLSECGGGDPTVLIRADTLLELVRGYREFLRLPKLHTRIDELHAEIDGIKRGLAENEATLDFLRSSHNRQHPDKPIEPFSIAVAGHRGGKESALIERMTQAFKASGATTVEIRVLTTPEENAVIAAAEAFRDAEEHWRQAINDNARWTVWFVKQVKIREAVNALRAARGAR
jgi:hypothetical protein